MQTMMTMTCPQPVHGDNDVVMQPLHSKTMCPQPAWEMMGMHPKRAPVLPMAWMRTQPYNPCAVMMTMWPKSIQVANDNNVATARMSDNNAPKHLMVPMWPHNSCVTEITHLSPVRDDQHCSLNIIL